MALSAFTIMAKPVSDKCNLKCEYCFYLGTAESLNNKPTECMSDETLEIFIRQYIAESSTPQVNFVWQGGEPTLAGLAFFEKAVALQKQYANGKQITNSIQTNGIAINKAWAQFFHQHQFLVGISLDGTQSAHDKYRITLSGGDTFSKVKQTVALFNDLQVEYNVLCTVNNANWNKGKSVYNNLKSIGARYIQFIPVVAFNRGKALPFNVPEKGFGSFLTDVFKEWVKADIGYMFVMNFESALSSYANGHALICFHNKECGAPLVIESNGDLYSCDHFVEDKYRLANIHSAAIESAIDSQQHQQFLALRNTSNCKKCEFIEMCNGGCPNHSKANGENYLCASYKAFFKSTQNDMRFIVNNIL
ncbi:anaerobic sulfatase maturase [Vibrio scophthalmi]|uniref:Anaerobic sulfatase-maturating enzyme n=1 Tax=Vibrio scophthalmi TaxID=45658 RepID=A0A1E3WH13_9VIBR|nr:anaerobic sulfatase maturase [Vibrio scophthalmi]ODS05060.1 Anaerobic sulfatase-maturating enzyme [Vibrio scophthalmi]